MTSSYDYEVYQSLLGDDPSYCQSKMAAMIAQRRDAKRMADVQMKPFSSQAERVRVRYEWKLYSL